MTDTNLPEVERVLSELHDRLLGKLPVLRELADEAIDHPEYTRIMGKIEGVKLALSFIEEAVRATPHSDDPKEA